MNDLSPCIDWAEKLALKPEDLAPSEYVALNAHLATCSACVAVSTDYHILTDRMRARPVPAVRPLPQLFPELFYLQEDQKKPWGQRMRGKECDRLRESVPSS